MKVFLDDERATPEGWTRAYWPDEVIALLRTGEVTHLSLDHDLGDDARGTGYSALLWLEEQVVVHGMRPPRLSVHSANSSARIKMEAAIRSIEKHAARGVAADEAAPVGSGHPVSEGCAGECCAMCGEPATHKVGEEVPSDDPSPGRHGLAAYVCCAHFRMLFGPAAPCRDSCQRCHGARGGVPGNENVIGGDVLCDYCSADRMRTASVAGTPLPAVSEACTAETAAAITDEREACARLLELSTAELLLGAGEMTAEELRTVKAVLAWRARAIRSRTEAESRATGLRAGERTSARLPY